MSQTTPRFCQHCGTPLEPGGRFCSHCGAPADSNTATPTELTPDQTLAADSTIPPPPPPPPADLETQPAPPFPYAQPPLYSDTPYPPYPPPAPVYPPPPVSVVPRTDSSKRVLGRTGCGVLAVTLVVLLIFGALSYVGWRFLASRALPSTPPGTSPPATTSTTGSTQGSQASQATVPIHQTVRYADVDITILTVEQAQSFADDSSTQAGAVRLNTREQNTSSRNTLYLYSDVARLILPDTSAVAPVNTQQIGGPPPAATQSNWWDFPISTSVKISDLTLQLGTNSQAQMEIPLTGKADVSQYQPRTSHPNAQTHYDGLTWTVTEATLSWSADGKQADKGMRYVSVALKIDNPSSSAFATYWGDYLRLQAGATTSAPTLDATIPTLIPAGSSGTTGSASFPVPAGTTSYTLLFLGNTTTGVSQASVNFQI
jgi:cytoskeletal protein RodZ